MVFLRALVSGSYLFGVGLPEEFLCGFFFRKTIFPCSALLGSTVDTCFLPVYGGFRTRILRSILVMLSCTGFGFGAALVSTAALVCLGWFCCYRRTSRYVPFFCFRVQRTAWSSVVHSMRQSTEWSNFMFFYVNMWITDPEVDSRLSGHVLWLLTSDSHLHGVRCSPLEYQTTDFPGDYFRNYFRIQHFLVRQWMHVGVSL